MTRASLSGAVAAVLACFCLAATATERRAPSASDFPEPNALPAHAEPVDALIMMDGSAVRTPDDWHGRRRPEVLKLLQHYLYGYSPPEELKEGTPPPRVVVEEANALGGKATARRIRIPLAPDPSVAIHVDLWVPNGGEGPFPTFLCIKYPNFPVSPLAREKPPWYEKAKPKIADGLKQVAYVIGRGYAFACFRANEAADHRFDKGIYPHYRPTRGKLLTWRYGGARAAHDWGEKMAWSWCARRAIDALVKQRGVDPNRIAVEGLSRNGVAALLTAAYHERVRLVICHQGSEFFGFGINRHVTHWYAAAVQEFQDKRDRLPVDTHCLVAAVAPRPILFSTSRTAGFCWPRFDAAMIKGAVPVYQLLGKPIQALTIPKSGVGIIGTGR